MSRYRFPAEWEPHEATFLCWPHNKTDWPGKVSTINFVFTEIVKKLSLSETVKILVDDKNREEKVRRLLMNSGCCIDNIEFWRIPTDRSWVRDYGPIFLDGPEGKVVADFHFNGWAKYSDWKLDTKVASKVAHRMKLPLIKATTRDIKNFRVEGGAVDVNGKGTLITTGECLLDQKVQVRNPGATKNEIESALLKYFGASNIIWLGRGIVGDDTHGHVDDICRFVNEKIVVMAEEQNANDVNYQPLQENRERLEDARLEDGSKLEVIPLPMPAPLYYKGHRLPASYANFYIANKVVLVPTFNDPNDYQAIGTLSELFNDRTVIGIHSVDLVWGLGAIHCLTQQF